MIKKRTKSSPLTAILFDFGGVLAEEGFREGLVALAREQGLNDGDIVREGTQAVYESGFVLGQGTAADFWGLMRNRTGLNGEDEELSKRILSGFVVRPGMISLVKELRAQGYVTGILSDQTCWLDELNERYHFSQAFDRIYNSYFIGKGKQDKSLFLDIAADLKLSSASILFVDDDEGNIDRAKSVGYQVIHYDDEKNFRLALERKLSGSENISTVKMH